MSVHFKKITIPVHMLAVLGLVLLALGVVDSSWLLATLGGWFLISGFGIAIGFHRLFSHMSFQTYPLIRNTLAFLGSMGAQGSAIFWASIHNGLHHPFADTPKDLHSPVLGYFNSYIGWQIHLKPEQVPFRLGAKLSRDPFLKFLHKNYIAVYWGTIVLVSIVSWKLALFGLIVPGMISIHQENLIDLFCHLPNAGYRNHNTKDHSVNNFLLGFLAFGQGWHNNHHARPADYNFGGDRWWEFDICNLIIPLIAVRQPKTSLQDLKLEVHGPKI